jgi:Amidase
MTFLHGPTTEELKETAVRLGLHIADGDLEFYRSSIDSTVSAYNAIAAVDEALPAVKYPRTPGYQPAGEENKYNAWYRKTEIRGAPTGKLKGKTVAIKDNVCVAGVPMMNGASTLEGYVPEIDATVVTRLLDAGATIAGKAHCEYFCFSGGSHTSAHGAVINPRKPGYSAGGSSSGSGALLAAGEVDLAIGGDQGGSIRMPSSYCGVYGARGGQAGAEWCRNLPQAGRQGGGGFDPFPCARHRDLDPDRSRRRHHADDARQWLRLQLEGPLSHQLNGPSRQLAREGGRAFGIAQGDDAGRRIHSAQIPGPLLRQMPKSEPRASDGL